MDNPEAYEYRQVPQDVDAERTLFINQLLHRFKNGLMGLAIKIIRFQNGARRYHRVIRFHIKEDCDGFG